MDATLSVLILSCLISFGMGSSGCGRNEVLNACGTACQATCEDPYPRCNKTCTGGSCDCVRGYVRDAQGICIPIEDCPNNIECGQNERFSICASACERSCAVPVPNPSCNDDCDGARCECGYEYVRNSRNVCVLLAECP